MAGPAPLQLKPYPGGALALDVTQARRCFPAFLICGILVSFLGAILPSWQHHLSSDYSTVGLYFLGLIAGLLSSVGAAPWLLEKRGLSWTLSFACAVAERFGYPSASLFAACGTAMALACVFSLSRRRPSPPHANR